MPHDECSPNPYSVGPFGLAASRVLNRFVLGRALRQRLVERNAQAAGGDNRAARHDLGVLLVSTVSGSIPETSLDGIGTRPMTGVLARNSVA